MITWCGSTKCDVCGNECKSVLYDAWGTTSDGNSGMCVMCTTCYRTYGVRGTKYKKNENGDYEKVLDKKAKARKSNPMMSVLMHEFGFSEDEAMMEMEDFGL